jgi:hypothetical protein
MQDCVGALGSGRSGGVAGARNAPALTTTALLEVGRTARWLTRANRVAAALVLRLVATDMLRDACMEAAIFSAAAGGVGEIV